MKRPHTISAKLLSLMVLLCALGFSSRAQTYCTPVWALPGYSCTQGFGKISTFDIVGFNGSLLTDVLPCSPDYKDRTAVVPAVDLASGDTYKGTIGIFGDRAAYNIWIDFNDDGTFSSTERLFAGNHTYTMTEYISGAPSYRNIDVFQFTIPATAPAGSHRMRLRSSITNFNLFLLDPCAVLVGSTNHFYGAAADYVVNIVPSSATCGPVFTTQPVQQATCAGSNLSYTVATAGSATLQWQVNMGSGFVNISDGVIYSGTASGTLTVTGITDQMNGYQYRCVANNGTCSSVSETAILWAKKVTISTQPLNRTAALDGSVSLNVTAPAITGITYSYQWQVNAGSGYVNIIADANYRFSINGSVLFISNATMAMNGNQYRCVVGNGTCTANSNASTLTVLNTPLPQYKYGIPSTSPTGSSMTPLGSNGSGYKQQCIYTPGDFGNMPAGLIRKIYVRSSGGSIATGYKNFTVKAGLSDLTSLDTFQSTLTEVRYDSILPMHAVTGYEWISIALQTPVFYDPAKSLLLEISHKGRSNFASGGVQIFIGTAHVNPAYTGYNSHTGGGTFTSKSMELPNMGIDIDPCLVITSKPGDISVNTDASTCEASNVSLGAPVATSSCGTVTITNNAPAVFPKGATIVTWTVTDGYITENFTQTVTVVDNVNPVFTSCPSNITVTAAMGECSADVNYAMPTATDNCGACSGNVPTSIPGYTLLGTYGGHTYFLSNNVGYWEDFNTYAQSIGSYLTTVGSAAENNFLSSLIGGEVWGGLTDKTTEGTFVWSNGEPVTYTNWCSSEPNNAGDEDYSLINWGSGGCWNDGAANRQAQAIIEFNCLPGASLNIARTAGPASGSSFPVGTTAVTYTATDASGNASTCSFNVTVMPVNTLSINVTPNGTQYTGGVPTNIYLGYGPQTAQMTANVAGGGNYTYSWSPTSNISGANTNTAVFAPTAPGTYTYTLTATKSNGCSYTATVTFCVIDINAPGGGTKIYICHNGNTQSVSVSAVPAHLNNHAGDKLGKCDQSCSSANRNSGGEEPVIEEFIEAEIKVYPNPSNGSFTIALPEGMDNAEVNMLDMTGKIIETKTGVAHSVRFDQQSVAKGVYMIVVKANDETYRTKVVIQ